MRLLFYSIFTSHVEVASTLICDTIVAVRTRTVPSLASAHKHRVPRLSQRGMPSPTTTQANASFARWQAHLLADWIANATSDYSLRMNLNRLRSGSFAIASRHDTGRRGNAHPHAA